MDAFSSELTATSRRDIHMFSTTDPMLANCYVQCGKFEDVLLLLIVVLFVHAKYLFMTWVVAAAAAGSKRGWTSYVEKDIAGSSSDGAEDIAAVAAGIALISIAAPSSILLQVSKKPIELDMNFECN
ncbi:hypothetical protein QYF36_024462 [Acer negundo]|nr:hypothetical protein QYF36_024462 [Acer negundo]